MENRDKKQNLFFETVILIMYISLVTVVICYHEPWFDEAQAWLIARDSTLKELIVSITHYEGHPPIWFLILMPVAKSGIPYEIGLKAVNVTIVSIAMALFIYKAPFDRAVRCTIPFTYFLFYQYAIISRPYSLMILGFVVSAICYRDRNEKPFRFVAALLIICGASAYGIIIVAGIAIVWIIEITADMRGLNKIIMLIKSRRAHALILLLSVNILFLLCIYPFSDTYAVNLSDRTVAVKLFYMFFVAPADAVCTYGYGGSPASMVFGIAASIFIYYIMLKLTSAVRKKALFILPYIMFALFSGMVYFSIHHLGIIALYIMFVCWICFDELKWYAKSEKNKYGNETIACTEVEYDSETEHSNLVEHDNCNNPLKCFGRRLYWSAKIFVIISIGISIYWSAAASFNDIMLNYGTGRELSKYITDNGMEARTIMVSWISHEISGKNVPDYNFMEGVPALPYFSRNIFYNFNGMQNNKCYLLHKINNSDEYINKIIDSSYPEILIGSDNEAYSFGMKINMEDYTIIKTITGHSIWKAGVTHNKVLVYVRNDLLRYYDNDGSR